MRKDLPNKNVKSNNSSNGSNKIPKIDIADQLVKTISTETITLDQIPIQVITQSIRETIQIQTLRTDTFPMTVHEPLQIIKTEIIQVIDIGNTQITDQKITLPVGKIIIVILGDSVRVLVIETTNIRTNQAIILSSHIKTFLNIQKRKTKTRKLVHRNIKDELFKSKLQMEQLQTFQVPTNSFQNYS